MSNNLRSKKESEQKGRNIQQNISEFSRTEGFQSFQIPKPQHNGQKETNSRAHCEILEHQRQKDDSTRSGEGEFVTY